MKVIRYDSDRGRGSNQTDGTLVAVGVTAIGYSLDQLIAVHALSAPSWLLCAVIGLVASVTFSRAAVAERVAAGLIFASILVESVVVGTNLDALGLLAPSHYYDPTSVLLDGENALGQVVTLLVGVVGTVAVAVVVFQHRDIT